MAGNMWGADVAGLRTLAQQFGKASDTLFQQSTLGLNSAGLLSRILATRSETPA